MLVRALSSVLLGAALAGCGAAPPVTKPKGPDRATRIEHGILAPEDVDEAIAEPCDGDSQVLLRGLSYFKAVGADAYARHGELLRHLGACAEDRASRGDTRGALELTRGGLTFLPNSDAFRTAHTNVRRLVGAPLFARAEAERGSGSRTAELYDLSLGLFVWPDQAGAAQRRTEVLRALEEQTTFWVVLEVTSDPSARGISRASLVRQLGTLPRLVKLAAPGENPPVGAPGVHLELRFTSRSVSRPAGACATDRVTVHVAGTRLESGARLDVPPKQISVGAPDCGAPDQASEPLALDREAAEFLRGVSHNAYLQYRQTLLDGAVSLAQGGRLDLALEPYVLGWVHHDGQLPSTEALLRVDRELLGTRQLDPPTLGQLDGFVGRFRPVPVHERKGGVVADGPAL